MDENSGQHEQVYMYISGGSEKVPNYADDVMYGWFLRQKYSVYPVEKFLLYLLEGTKNFFDRTLWLTRQKQ